MDRILLVWVHLSNGVKIEAMYLMMKIKALLLGIMFVTMMTLTTVRK
jgi:hypothetical protein